MSPVGHTIIGLAFAAVAMPSMSGPKRKLTCGVAFAAIANLPDWPIPYWGHQRYLISHSVFVNLALIGIAAVLLRRRFRAKLILLATGAWLSHLLLDSFYSHGQGIAIYWPVSTGRLNLAMPWFRNLDLSQSPISGHNLSVGLVELLAFAPILWAAVAFTYWLDKRNGPKP